jgi:serine/threonine protein kinase
VKIKWLTAGVRSGDEIMIGEIISHYRILEKIAEGGMGVVYKAEDIHLKRLAALKFLPPEYTRDRLARERFKREAQAAAALNNPNIITVHEIDEYDGHIYIAAGCRRQPCKSSRRCRRQ